MDLTQANLSSLNSVMHAVLDVARSAHIAARALPYRELGPMPIAFADYVAAPEYARVDMVELSLWCEAFGHSSAFTDLIEQYQNLLNGINAERTRLLALYRAATEDLLHKEDRPSFYEFLQAFIERHQTYTPYSA